MKFRDNPARLYQFIDVHCFHVPGASILFREFSLRFREFCPISERVFWTPFKLSRALREAGIEVGARTGNVTHVGNLSWRPGLPNGELVTVPPRRLIRV